MASNFNRMAFMSTCAAVLVWAAQASLAVSLGNIPPFLLTGMTLAIGGTLALPKIRSWTFSWRAMGIGVYGIFVYHFFYFLALRNAPAIEANLVHYLWPALIVVMTPAFSKEKRIHWNHFSGVLCGLAGAAIAAIGSTGLAAASFKIGYIYALAAAFVWASYSLLLGTLRGYKTWTTGGVCLISGALSFICHAMLEPHVSISSRDWILIVCQGLGPMGIAFYLWDYGMRHGDSRIVGVLAYAIPVLSTLVLSIVTGRVINTSIIVATILVIVGGLLGFIKRPKRSLETTA